MYKGNGYCFKQMTNLNHHHFSQKEPWFSEVVKNAKLEPFVKIGKKKRERRNRLNIINLCILRL